MKHHHIFRIASFCFLCALFCCKPEQQPGSIYGTVTDEATGDCVANAGVELFPKGYKTVTGFDGSFEFTLIEPGDYNLYVTKTGYRDLKSSTITVTSGETVKGDVQIEKLPLALRVVDSDGQDISSLDFGVEPDVTSRTFSIFNDSPQQLTWWVEENCNWITEVKSMLTNNQSGQLEAGRQEPIKITIDRSLTGLGAKSYILNINSDNGSKELLITVGESTGLPILVTNTVTDISQNAATFHGAIIDEGIPSYAERGFVYSTNAQPTIQNSAGKITTSVNNQTDFSASVYDLNPNSTYYVRAYAINAIDVAYGDDVCFQTSIMPTSLSTSAATNISNTTATFNATIIQEGNPTYTERGFCYGIVNNPTIANNKVIVSGSGTGNYSFNIEGLEYQTKYYVRAYAIQKGQPLYGNTVSFSTAWTAVQLNTSAVTNISPSSATFNGAVINAGSPALSEKGFCYSKTDNPTITNNKIIVPNNNVGEYSYDITGLDYTTTYYVRTYAIQNEEPVYGNIVYFTTTWTDAEVQTTGITNIEASTATLNGFVSNIGSPVYSERGFCYDDMTAVPTISNHKVVVSGAGGYGNYSKNITNLISGRTYHARAYVIQNGTPIYGNVENFTTTMDPVVLTKEVTDIYGSGIMDFHATFHGEIVSIGSPAYVERGFCYGITSSPTINNSVITVSGSGAGTYSVVCSELVSYTTYHVRAYAKTPSGNYIYGQSVSFETGGFLIDNGASNVTR